MKLKCFLIKHKRLILQIIDTIQIINVFLNVKLVSAFIILLRKIIDKINDEKGETK